MRWFLALVMTLALIITAVPTPPIAEAHVVRYGKTAVESQLVAPKWRGARVYFPIRFVTESLGWEVRWVDSVWHPNTVAVNRDLSVIERRLIGVYDDALERFSKKTGGEPVAGYNLAAGYQYTAERGFEPTCGREAVWNPTPARGDEADCFMFPPPPPESASQRWSKPVIRLIVDAGDERELSLEQGDSFLERGRVWVEESLLERLLGVTIEP